MPPNPTPTPTNHTIFDPWNSSATGHQRAENPYSNTTSWRETRRAKLAIQFAAPTTTATTNKHDPGGAGGEGEWKWVSGSEAARHQLGCRDIRTMMGGMVKKRGRDVDVDDDKGTEGNKFKYKKGNKDEILCQMQTNTPETRTEVKSENEDKTETDNEKENDNESEGAGASASAGTDARRKLLSGTTIYINGSTMPHISDHRLKSMLVAHGAEVAISLARRSVTHVIVGKPNGAPATSGAGAGGGLAAGKLQKEIARGGWRGVKVVGVEWALESIKAGKRLSEARFAMDLAPGGQRSVLGMFRR